MQKQNRLVMRAILRLAIAQHPRALRNQTVAGRQDIRNFVTNMMHAAGRVLVEEGLDRRPLTQRVQQFDLAVVQFNKDDRDTVRRQILRLGHGGAQRIAIHRARGLQVRNGYRHMVQSTDHHIVSRNLRLKTHKMYINRGPFAT